MLKRKVMEILCCSVVNIFQVTRAAEYIDFRSDVGNVRLLSHASRVENFVGILSRFHLTAFLLFSQLLRA